MTTVTSARYMFVLRRRIRILEELVTQLQQTLATLNEDLTRTMCQNYHLARLVQAAKQGMECYKEMKAEMEDEIMKLRRQVSGQGQSHGGINTVNNVLSAPHNAMYH